MDQPWENKLENDKGSPDGPCGSKGLYGWWRRRNNEITSIDAYVEKIEEPQLRSCASLTTDHYEQNRKVIITWVTVTLVLLLFISLVAVLFFLYRRFKAYKHKLIKLTAKDIEEFENGFKASNDNGENVEMAQQLPYNRRFELNDDDFVIDKDCVLGNGQFGIVYKGKIRMSAMEVAFKTTKPRCPIENVKSFLAEIKLMIYIGEHLNIVSFVGAYTKHLKIGEIYIASEFCSGGSLQKVLRSFCSRNYANEDGILQADINSSDSRYIKTPRITYRKEESLLQKAHELSMSNLIKWSFHIASGMNYLASKKVIHGDLATRNVLLTETGTAKITDFGLSRKLHEYSQYVKKGQEPLPWRWLAIESLRHFKFSSQSDVWSYGVTLWEIFSTGDIPYPGLNWNINFVTELEMGLRLNKPKDASEEIFKLMDGCWRVDPEQRPTFSALATFFGSLLKNEEINLDYRTLSEVVDND